MTPDARRAEAAKFDRLFQVSGQGYTAGLVIRGGRVIEAAPILKWTVGLTEREARARLVRLTIEEVGLR